MGMAEPTYHCDTGMRYLAFGGIPVGKYFGGGNVQAAIFAKNIIKWYDIIKTAFTVTLSKWTTWIWHNGEQDSSRSCSKNCDVIRWLFCYNKHRGIKIRNWWEQNG